MSVTVPDDAPKPRLCHVRKWEDFTGYGFNLHAEKGKAGQYIGKVDPGSPADLAGMKEGDRIVEINGTNISNENHQQVVQRVKAIPNETKMLVIDSEAEEYYKAQKIVVRGDMPNVAFFVTPEGNPASSSAVVENNVSDSGSEKGEDNKSARSSRSSSPSRSEVAEAVVAAVVASDPPTAHPYKARLCYLKIWSNFAGYGFNLHAEKNKTGQYIGKVDAGSPADAAGLREHDRIIEVNDENVTGESHQHVVTLVKSVPNATRLLVLSPEADDYFRDRDVRVTHNSDFVDRIECPDTKPADSPVNLDAPADSFAFKARQVELRTWSNYSGYGFNMHSIKGKEGEYIGKVEPGSPAAVAGLKEGDRVIEVGGFNTEKSSHSEVVDKIKAAAGRASLLVVDAEADAYFREKQISLNRSMAAVTVLTCPDNKPADSDVNLDAPADSFAFKARQVELRTWSNYSGYGFNMHSIKGKEGEYIGKVEPGSPAAVAGLKEGDRVIEVGGFNTEKSSHSEVVDKIKAAAGRASLLVVDAEADAYFREKQISLNRSMAAVTVLTCPDNKPEANGVSEGIHSQEDEEEEPTVTNGYTEPEVVEPTPEVVEPTPEVVEPTPEPEEAAVSSSATTRDEVSMEADKIADSIMASVLEAEKSLDANEVDQPPVVVSTEDDDINDYEQVNDDIRPPSPTDPSNNNEEAKDEIIENAAPEELPPSYESEEVSSQAQASPAYVAPTPAPAPVKKDPVVVGGLEFAGSVEEARKKMGGKKRESRHTGPMSAKEKYELFQKL